MRRLPGNAARGRAGLAVVLMRTTVAIRAAIRRIETLPPRHRWVMKEALGELRSEHLRAWTRERDEMTRTRLYTMDDVNLHPTIRRGELREVLAVVTPDGSWSVTIKSTEPGIQVHAGGKVLRGHEDVVLEKAAGYAMEIPGYPGEYSLRDAVIACREAIADYMLRHARAEVAS